ncbi:prepilin-type N-terminal cleavage/methylation domain-containing protein [Nautilia sp.]
MKAFTLIELIFVVIIMGILSFVGFQFIPNEKLFSDREVLVQKILEKKANALGYEAEGNESYYCITFTKEWLNNDDNKSSEKVHYVFKSDISVTPSLYNDTLCFDYVGRDYNGSADENLTNLLHTNIIITLKYRKKEENITIYPITGSVR